MPMVTVITNAARSLATQEFAAELGKLVGTHLNRPENYVTVRIVPDQIMYSGGQPQPFAQVEIQSLSGLNEKKNSEMAPEVTSVVEKHLKFSGGNGKVLLSFNRIDPTTCGIDGKTFPPGFAQDE